MKKTFRRVISFLLAISMAALFIVLSRENFTNQTPYTVRVHVAILRRDMNAHIPNREELQT